MLFTSALAVLLSLPLLLLLLIVLLIEVVKLGWFLILDTNWSLSLSPAAVHHVLEQVVPLLFCGIRRFALID